MPDTVGNLGSLLFLGFLLGVRHATDADHIVAIATIVSRRRNLRGSTMVGAVWGIGRTLTILVVGGAIILFGVIIPPRLGLAMEFGVGIHAHSTWRADQALVPVELSPVNIALVVVIDQNLPAAAILVWAALSGSATRRRGSGGEQSRHLAQMTATDFRPSDDASVPPEPGNCR